MFRQSVPLLLVVSSVIAEEGRWAFAPKPDPFTENAILDLRSLNEAIAGEKGFVKIDAKGDFLDGTGKPLRFWAVNTTVSDGQPSPNSSHPQRDLDRHVRHLAKLGVNLARSFQQFYARTPGWDGGPLDDPQAANDAEIDALWRLVAAAKKQGIYVLSTPYWPVTLRIPASWGIAGRDKQNAQGLLFFNEKLQTAYKAWLKRAYTTVNPHTGIALKDDPALACIQLQNEDSLLFWTFNAMDLEQQRELGRRFAIWAAKKHGSIAKALEVWGGPKPSEKGFADDDAAAGILGFINLWFLTAGAPAANGARGTRLNDQLQFLSETMRAFNADMGRYLRQELQLKCLINSGNWKTADTGTLNDCERWSYSANEVQAVNRYYGGIHQGKNNGWAIVPGDRYSAITALTDPSNLPVNLKQVAGSPMLVTESCWVPPAKYRSEGPALIAAYSALSGVDAYFWYNFTFTEWTPPTSANGFLNPSQGKWVSATPDHAGQFPAAALMFRKDYIRRGKTAIHEERPLTDLWERKPALINEGTSFDPNRDAGDAAMASKAVSANHPLSFLVGPVEVVYGGDPAKNTIDDLGRYNNLRDRTVRSNTGELCLDYGKRVFTIDAPRAQGVVGFLKEAGGSLATADVEYRSGNTYAAVLVVALDGQPLKTSKKVLVQVGTDCIATGWADRPVQIQVKDSQQTVPGFEVIDVGTAPWLVADTRLSLTVKNPGLRKAMRLDVQGYAAGELAVAAAAGGLAVELPRDAMYVVLTP